MNKNKENNTNVQSWTNINPQTVLPGLEKLCKIFGENQAKIDNQLSAVGNGNQPYVSEFVPNRGIN